MPPSYFPLRWESTGDQWWYASPIDWAAANGLYDLVSELLHLDTNLLIKLTSLRRIRRLETVWDDEDQFHDAAKCRSFVARRLLDECETKKGHNSLIRAGYGGWFLYTAASAGDVDFVKELLERDPLLVFGEGEYGVTDLFYAAARSKRPEVFRLLLDSAFSPKCFRSKGGEDGSVFKWEMMNRAVHAAARGGNVAVLRELLGGSENVLVYRDAQGSTVLHTASGRGQVEVVRHLIASQDDIITSIDNQGNTALHVAAYRGYLAVVELLIHQCPSLASSTNNHGDTFLHMAVAGFRTPGFRRLDRQIELMEKLVCGKLLDMEDIINASNNEGRTALHVAVAENIQSNVVELLMTVPSMDLNIRDADHMTPLDLLKQRPKSASSEILIKRIVSAGGMISGDLKGRVVIFSHLKTHGIGSSPGTSFRIPDAEIYLYMDIDGASDCDDAASIESCSFSGEISPCIDSTNMSTNKKSNSVNYAAKQLRNLLRWSRGKERIGTDDSSEMLSVHRDSDSRPVSLRQRYSKSSVLPSNKRTNLPPSPSTKRNYAFGLMHGVINATQRLAVASSQSPLSPLSRSAVASPSSVQKQRSNGREMSYKQASLDKKVMNEYFCFGAQGLAVEESISTYTRPMQSLKHVSSLTA